MQIPGSVFHSHLHGQCGSFPWSLLPVQADVSWVKTRGLWTEKPRGEVQGWQALQGGMVSLQVRNLAGKTSLGMRIFSCVSVRSPRAVQGLTWAGFCFFWDPTDYGCQLKN